MNLRRTATILALIGFFDIAGLICATGAIGHAQQKPQQTPAASSNSNGTSQGTPSSVPSMPGMNMPGMNMPGMGSMDPGANIGKNAESHTEADAMRSMQPGHSMHMHMMDGPHMHMTTMRPATAEDWERADEIAATLRDAIDKYKDYHVALREGFRIFLPNLPQAEYHFNSTWNGFLESFTFDPARPTSLLYRKTKDGGWTLVGAMYTAPKTDTPDQLDERIPLGVARWHAHINLCIPKGGLNVQNIDWRRFGLEGSIATPQACTEAGGRFYPQIFGWMVHVYPFETTREKIWGQ